MENNQQREMSLAELRQTELEILRYFKTFCERENIRYFLSNGTLLGAVKYGGFIPWDDDVDVFVPREDYDRLIQLFQDSDRYRLFSIEREEKYRFPFAKLCDITTEKIEENIDNGVRLGVDIDIFPLDVWCDDYTSALKQMTAIQKRIQLLTFLKCRKALSKNPIKRMLKSLVLTLAKPVCRPLVRNMVRIAESNRNASSPQWLGCVAWCIYAERELVPAEAFEKSIEVEFEGERYPAPAGYDVYLKRIYGEYRMDPPLDQQVTHHRFTAFSQLGGNRK